MTANVARHLTRVASQMPAAIAVASPAGRDAAGRRQYDTFTFRQLDDDSNRLAAGLRDLGMRPGQRVALLVRPGLDFVSLVYALLKSGVVAILIDPGMGRRNLIDCLAAAQPEGFVALSVVQAVRMLLRRRFPQARHNVTVGRRWFWGGPTLAQLRRHPANEAVLADVAATDDAAVIFTTGSTGPPKGVLYSHGNFDHQVSEIRDRYGIAPGEVNLAAFPLFGLFNASMGVTTVIADIDASRPASVDPANIVEAVADWHVTQSFASPAVWNKVGPYCAERRLRLETLRQVYSAGAPVPPHVLESMRACIHPEGDIHTPYGATEALPVATISGSEVLGDTINGWRNGRGTCVGRRFAEIAWRVIPIHDGPIATLADAPSLPPGEIGELIVSGPVVTRRYVTRVEANATGKISDGNQVWHRMGDVGHIDEYDRFWFCGRMAHRVTTPAGPLFTIPCEAIYNQHPRVFRSALVGIGPATRQTPVMLCEPWSGQMPSGPAEQRALVDELLALGRQHATTRMIDQVLLHPGFPVDIRHNAKIFRERLAPWAERQLRAASR